MADIIGSLEQDAIMSFFNFWSARVADDLSKIINKVVTIGSGMWRIVQTSSLKEQYPLPRLLGTIEMENQEPFYIFMMAKDAAIFVDLFMGGDGTGVQEEFNEVQLNIVEEMVNQMGAALANTLSQFTGKICKPLPPKVTLNGMSALPPQLISLTYQIKIKDLLTGPFVLLLAIHQAVELGNTLMQLKPAEAAEKRETASQSHAPTFHSKPKVQEEKEVTAKPVQFTQVVSQSPAQKVGNIDLIFDVLLQLTAVLGRTGISIKDLVELGPGSVLELDKLVGEAVELYANNKLVAKGEVVVIDERFAVRVTETVAPAERLQGLKG